MTWREGQDGVVPRYQERLLPRWWVWLAAGGFIGMIAVAYGHAYGAVGGWAVAAAGAAIATWLLISGAPMIRVDERVLRAGRARLPLAHVGRVVPLDAQRSREARSTRLDPAAFLLLRTTTAPGSVMVEVTDPDDPHPYWLITAKRPERLATALREAVEESQAPTAVAPSREGGL